MNRQGMANKLTRSSSGGGARQGKKLEVELTWHDDQWAAFHDPVRFKVLLCGRRWGKTRGGIQWLAERNVSSKERVSWWVSPTYRQAKIAYRYFRKIFRTSGIIKSDNKAELVIGTIFGGRMEFRSSEIADNLRGEGVDDLVLDECGVMAEEVWTEVLRPTLIDTKGYAVFIGTPKGPNWFHQLYLKGQSGQDPEWKSWQFSTYNNPYVDKAEVAKVEASLPELVVRQEIYAEPMDGAGTVFRNVDDLSTLQPEEPKEGEFYTMGVDLAKYRDFTVIAVCLGKRQVYMERFNRIDWALQKRRIIDVALRFNHAETWVDSTGVGDPIFEDLSRASLDVHPYQLTSASKSELIDNLVMLMDKREVTMLDDPVQKAELKGYEYELTSGGRLRTNAPNGKHDDTVIALALALANSIAQSGEGLLDYMRQEMERIEEAKGGRTAEA